MTDFLFMSGQHDFGKLSQSAKAPQRTHAAAARHLSGFPITPFCPGQPSEGLPKGLEDTQLLAFEATKPSLPFRSGGFTPSGDYEKDEQDDDGPAPSDVQESSDDFLCLLCNYVHGDSEKCNGE